MNKKLKSSHIAPLSKNMGPHVKQVIPSAIENVDPFVFLDHFGPFIKTPDFAGVPPHPHAGIATITYLFEGSNRHQDSYGHDAVIQAGDLAWMSAGKGIIHAEGMEENRTGDQVVHGLQLWISLPAKDKFSTPDFNHYESHHFPVIVEDEVYYKIICGSYKGLVSPVKSLSPAFIYELKIPAGKQVKLAIHPEFNSGIYVIQGAITTDGVSLHAFSMSKFELEGEIIELEALENAHIVVIGGKPLNEPIVPYASFVMNSMAQVEQVISDYNLGKMGKL